MKQDSRLHIIIDGVLLAFQFLSILPLKKEVPWDAKRASASLSAYPVVGLVLGAILAIISYMVLTFSSFPITLISFFLLCLSIIYSGGLHLDGWMDVSDAVLSHRSRERKLEIMKDPRVGPFAVLSLFFLLGWRYLFIYETLKLTKEIWLYILLIPFLTRWIMGWMLLFGKPARNEGLAYMFQSFITHSIKTIYVFWLLIPIGIFVLFHRPFLVNWFIILIILFLYYLFAKKFFYHQFDGITGDTVGATGEGGETLLWMIVYLLHYFAMA